MPQTRRTELPARLSRKVLMTGTPPPTAASNASDAPRLSASRARSSPCAASIALFAVTTGRPRERAATTASMSDPVRAADQFDEHVDVAGGREFARIGEEGDFAKIEAAIPLRPRADGDDDDVAARASGEIRATPLQQPHQRRPDHAQDRRRRRAKVSPWLVVLRSSRART